MASQPNRKTKASEGEEPAKRQKGCFSDITVTRLLQFEAAFAGHGWKFDESNRKFTASKLGQWITPMGLEKLKEWLRSQAGEWAAAYRIIKNRNNERSLYPLLFEVLKSLLLIVRCNIDDVRVGPDPPSDAVIESGASRFAADHTPSASRTPSADKPDASALEVDSAGAGAGSTPAGMLDITDERAVTNLFLEVEKYIQEEIEGSGARGHAEFTITNSATEMILAAFEVKPSLAADKRAGLFQLVSELITVAHSNFALAKPERPAPTYVYGVYTDTRDYMFVRVRLQDQSIEISPSFGLFSSNHEGLLLDFDAPTVAAYLFHILDVPIDIDVKQAVEKLEAKKEGMGVWCCRPINSSSAK